MQTEYELSTGIAELDHLLRGLLPGDNVVWKVQSIEDYRPFILPFCRRANDTGRSLTYFRFGRHAPLLDENCGAAVCELDPKEGFEPFLDAIHATIEQAGRGAYFVFDCLSDLTVDWFSDHMLANFFMLTCPYIYDREGFAYFAVCRNYHSLHATLPIRNTTQVLLDVYRYRERLYLQLLKVQRRFSSQMHLLHVWNEGSFDAVTDSCTVSSVLNATPGSALLSAFDRMDVWNRAFLQAEQLLHDNRHLQRDSEQENEIKSKLLRMLISRDPRMLALAEKHMSIEDVLAISRRTIGTGLIGGKAVGMLIARGVVSKASKEWEALLEPHDSYYIASDVFYEYLVHNGVWWVRRRQKDPRRFLEGAEQARQRILTGTFPEATIRQFEDMLSYFGRSPIIVRSSSLLEDNYGNSFAGKYQSVFCVNQIPQHQRLEDFLAAVRTVYASSMSEEALAYRARHDLLDRDEQMALLVQRVSGAHHGDFYYPHTAGVGFSYNPFAWSQEIDPDAGMLRLVYGMGTRAVDRSDDDYTRVLALNAPLRRPEMDGASEAQAQQKVDVLDLEGNQLLTVRFDDVLQSGANVPLHLFARQDSRYAREARAHGRKAPPPRLNFESLLKKTSFVEDMRAILGAIEAAYEYPVDVEFTANFDEEGRYRLNLVQCRPLQVKGSAPVRPLPQDVARDQILLKSKGYVIGHSRISHLRRIILVRPEAYAALPLRDRYSVARLVGRVVQASGAAMPAEELMLVGPGRWGTSSPSLGVPVNFAEINRVGTICELVMMRKDLVPDASLGTHFLSELIETDMLYLAVVPNEAQTVLNLDFLLSCENQLPQVVPQAEAMAGVVHVVDREQLVAQGEEIVLHADALEQQAICYRNGKVAEASEDATQALSEADSRKL